MKRQPEPVTQPAPQPAQEAPMETDHQSTHADEHAGEGGSYEIVDGKRRLVSRTATPQ